ncbi:MAG TPA: quinoprotein dehydrogenase-associated putative ABC transporter substrate-binding protein [Trueperaceae bacterium]
MAGAAARAVMVIATVAAFAFVAQARAGAWELRVCGYGDSLPFADESGAGFENQIAEIVADELEADLTYGWWYQDATMVSSQLGEGRCDVLLGVPDGFEELLNTVTYYRSPYVFVERADSGLDVSTLDDPRLSTLRIGVQNVGIPPHNALLGRGLAANVVLAPPLTEHGRVVAAVAAGDLDVGVVWGPVAAYYAARSGTPLKLTPVQPEVDLPFGSMVLPIAMAVRPGDTSLRDALDGAIAARWDEIQAVLTEHGVPLLPSVEPVVNEAPAARAKVGVVTPTLLGVPTLEASLYELVGESARRGALLAESLLAAGPGDPVAVLVASAPSVEAAERAAQRLAAAGASALVGGINDEQALALAEVAEQSGIPFLNIGSSAQSLRSPLCFPHTFSVEASSAMYLGAMVEGAGEQRWYVIHEESESGRALRDLALEIVRGAGADVVGDASTVAGQALYRDVVSAAESAGATAIMLLLGPRDQIPFVAQANGFAAGLLVVPFPHQVTQTRDFLAAEVNLTGAGLTRVALWDPSLEGGAAGAVNERFGGRWGAPLESSGWAAFAAVLIAAEGFGADGAPDLPNMAGLGKPQARFGADHQLRQDLYLVAPDPEATYGVELSRLTALARVAAVLPPGAAAEPSGASTSCAAPR